MRRRSSSGTTAGDEKLLDTHTFYFCPDHREQLFRLKETKTLPPAEWFAETDT